MITLSPRYAIAAGITLALIGAIALQSWRLDRSQRRNHALTQTIAQIETASAHAADKARVARLWQEAQYRALAERTDEHAEQAQADAMDSARRFIDANRVRCPAVGSPTGGTGASASGGSAEGADRSGAASELDAGLIAVPESDVLICTKNTVRLEQAQEWAAGLADQNPIR